MFVFMTIIAYFLQKLTNKNKIIVIILPLFQVDIKFCDLYNFPSPFGIIKHFRE